jgi:DnaJ-class molecular chaperone
VKVPAGVREGQRIRLAGEGAAGAGGKRGDLFLRVNLAKDATFERQGDDLYVDVSVPFTVAALGGDVIVKTLHGNRTMSVPPGVQSGQKIRVSGEGLPGGKNKPAGNLYARLRVSVPKDLSERERQLLQELAEIRRDPVATAVRSA